MNSKTKKTLVLVEGAIMIALATVLSYLKVYELPQGGSITLEMIPLVVMGIRRGNKWGCFTGFVHGILQMVLGFSNVLYCNTILSQFGCIMLDYVLAFTVLGLSSIFMGLFKNKKVVGVICGSVFVGLLRFLCSFLSGWLLWGSYAPEGQSAYMYSLIYNGSYMIPNIIIMSVAVALIYKIVPKLFTNKK